MVEDNDDGDDDDDGDGGDDDGDGDGGEDDGCAVKMMVIEIWVGEMNSN